MFNRRARALFSGGVRALFTGSVRVLSNPRARALVSRHRRLLVALGLGLLALGLAAPLTGSPQKTYRNLRAQTPQSTASAASSAAAPAPQGGASPTGAGGAPALPTKSPSGSGSGSGAPSASSGAAISSGGATASSAGGSQSSAPATSNAVNQPGVQSARVHLTVGVSDNSSAMFSQHLFQRLRITTARVMVPWNVAVMRDKTLLRSAQVWINWALSQRVAPMVSFAGNGNYIPSYQVYAAAVKAFLHDFPKVKIYTPWNEPDWIYRPALANNPRLAADYFNVLIRWCHHCTIVAGDVYRPSWQGLASWVGTYSHYLHARPKAWALHPYDDVRSHTTSQLRALVSVIRNAPIWLTEISGVERRGHWGFPNQSPNGANNDERYLFLLPKHFNVQRIYHYQWQAVAAAPWDSALVGPQGKPRPAYWTFANAIKGKLP